MPVNWGIQDFNLGQARNKLDLAPAINIYQNAKKVNAQRNLADLELDKEARRKKKSEEIQQMRMASISPDGKPDTQGYIQRLTQAGYTDEAVKEQKLFNDQQKSIFEQNKQLENTLDRHAKTYSNLETDVEKQDFYTRNMATSPLMGNKPWSPQLDSEIMASTVKPLTQKEQFERDKVDRDNRLSEEFRTKFLPGLDITGLETDKNAINTLRKQILSSPYAQSSLAKQTLKALKAPQESIAKQMMSVMSKMDVAETKLTQDEQKGLGAVEPTIVDLNKLVDLYTAGGTGTIGSSIASGFSKIPVFGQRLSPDAAGYNKHKVLLAERFLRAATGAAAPKEEKVEYAGYLPDWGDTPQQAQIALNTFVRHVKAKAETPISKLRALDTKISNAKADKIEAKINRMFEGMKSIEEPKLTVGDIDDGYKYIGGDPSQPSSWQKVGG